MNVCHLHIAVCIGIWGFGWYCSEFQFHQHKENLIKWSKLPEIRGDSSFLSSMVVLRMGCGRQYNYKRVAGLFIFREDDSFNYYFVKTWWRGKIADLSIIIITLLNFWFQRFKNSDDWFHLLVTKSDIKVKTIAHWTHVWSGLPQ